MTLTEAQTTKPATDALTELVQVARERGHDRIAQTLDGARTRLVEDGTDYLDAAWAFVDAGRKQLAELAGGATYLDRIRSKADDRG